VRSATQRCNENSFVFLLKQLLHTPRIELPFAIAMSVDSKLAALKKQRDMCDPRATACSPNRAHRYTSSMKTPQQQLPQKHNTSAAATVGSLPSANYSSRPPSSSSSSSFSAAADTCSLHNARDPMRASRVGAISTNLPMPEAMNQRLFPYFNL
jgi:hypothetical protein